MFAQGLLDRWLPESWDAVGLQALESLTCMGTAVICGLIVGMERESSHKPAGVRTHILVCLGSAAFVHIGVVAQLSGAKLGSVADFNRLIQSVATGIGFLGAGAIFRAEDRITGVTTAASIWIMGAVGAAAGAGAVALALLVSVMGFCVLRGLRILDKD